MSKINLNSSQNNSPQKRRENVEKEFVPFLRDMPDLCLKITLLKRGGKILDIRGSGRKLFYEESQNNSPQKRRENCRNIRYTNFSGWENPVSK